MCGQAGERKAVWHIGSTSRKQMMEMLLRSKDKMVCPNCSQPMTKGYFQSAREIFFTEHPHRVLFSPKNDEVSLSEKNNTAPICPAWPCPACQKVIIEHGEGR